MPHLDHHDGTIGIEDLVENPICTNANPVPLLSGQFLASRRTRIIAQGSDSLHDTTDIASGNTTEVPGNRCLYAQIISCHPP